MKSNLSLLASFLVLLLTSPFASAQSDGGPPVSMKIDFVAWGDRPPDLTVKKGAKQEPIIALPFTYSKPIDYVGSSKMEIYRNAGTPLSTGEGSGVPPALAALQKEKPGIVSLVTLPTSSRRVTVLLAPSAGGTYQTYVIDDDPTKLPFGSLRIHNYSSDTVAFKCNGKTNNPMKPGQSIIVPPVEGLVAFDMGYLQGDKWKKQESNVAVVSPSEQVQMIVLKSNNSYFVGPGGTRAGYLQVVTLRRPRIEVETDDVPPPSQPRSQDEGN